MTGLQQSPSYATTWSALSCSHSSTSSSPRSHLWSWSSPMSLRMATSRRRTCSTGRSGWCRDPRGSPWRPHWQSLQWLCIYIEFKVIVILWFLWNLLMDRNNEQIVTPHTVRGMTAMNVKWVSTTVWISGLSSRNPVCNCNCPLGNKRFLKYWKKKNEYKVGEFLLVNPVLVT